MESLQNALQYIQSKTDFKPQAGIILGTGLGNLVNDIEIEIALDYADIPHFPLSTVESHSGRLIFGHIGGKPIVAMQGRFHYYEGYNMQEVTFPVRVMKLLGISHLFISNVSGSVNATLEKGDLMILEDHIYLQYENPLTGPNLDEMGPRFPDMSAPYDAALMKKALAIAKELGFRARTGVYASVPGPNLETKAEYRYLNIIGADAVGMSTVPEVLVAVHCGLKVFAISVITDKNFPIDEVEAVTVEEVIKVALATEPKMTEVVKRLIADTSF